jgi:outer membrane protein assembly factor BamB
MRVGQVFFRWWRAAIWAAALVVIPNLSAPAQVMVFNGNDEEVSTAGGFTLKKVDPKITDALADFNRYVEKLAWEKAFKAIAPLADVEVTGMVPSKDGFLFPARQAVMNTFLAMPPEGREAYRLFNDAKAKQLYDQATQHPDTSDDDIPTLRKLLGLYFITSVGHQAADRLGDDLFESGDFGGAEQAWAAIIEQQDQSELNIPRIQLKRGVAMVRTHQITRAKEIVAWLKDHAAGSKMTVGGQDVEPAEFLQALIDAPTDTTPTTGPTTRYTSTPESELPPISLPKSDTPKWHFEFGNDGLADQISQQVRNFGWQNMMPDLLAIVPGSAADEKHAYINWMGICYGLDARTGKLLWRTDKPSDIGQNVQQFIQFSPEVVRYTAAAAGDRALFVRIPPKRMNFNEPYRLCCFNAQTGAQQWSSESGTLSGYNFSCVPLVVDETVYATAATNNGNEVFLVAINITNGRSLWTLSLGQATTGTNWRGMPQLPVCNLLQNGGKIYVLTNNGAAICVNTGEKRVMWAFTMPGAAVYTGQWFNRPAPTEEIRTPASMFTKDNVLYLKERDANMMYAVDLAGPSLKWKRPLEPDETIVGLDDSRLYIAGHDIGGIDAASHALLWSTRLPLDTGTYRPMMSGASIFYFAGRGVYQIDAKNGDIKRIFRGYDRDSNGGAIYQSAAGVITVSDKALTAYPSAQSQ